MFGSIFMYIFRPKMVPNIGRNMVVSKEPNMDPNMGSNTRLKMIPNMDTHRPQYGCISFPNMVTNMAPSMGPKMEPTYGTNVGPLGYCQSGFVQGVVSNFVCDETGKISKYCGRPQIDCLPKTVWKCGRS